MQKLAEICVRRPVFATMLVMALTVVGAASFFKLGVDRYPRIETPVVSVSTSNPGATPESIETEVTDRVEAAVNTVAGIDELRSTSSEGSSRVTITFDLSKNPDIAAQEVRAKVDPVIRNLPETADPPVVQKQDPDSTPIILFSVSAPMSSVELTTFIEQNIQKRIESISGVGEVVLYGARRREVQVKIDPDRLNAYALSTTDVATALRAQNLELPGGRLEQGERELSVRTVGRLTRPQDFEDLVVATRGNSPIRIRDIGTVEDTGATPTSVSMLNGKPAVSIAIRKQSGVNTVALADAIRARMAEIKATLPPTFDVRLIRDDSEFIRASLHAIEEHLVLGGILAAIIVLLFLRSFRSTLIAAIAIPASIIGAFSLMAALDFTLNQMTMLALTLMVGIVIDDAIVVLENIYRFVEEKGMSPFQAAIEGTREIGLAVMATTMALLAVFVPVGFLGGIIGRFMSSFGLTAAAAIAISLIVSFTLTPMLAARWIKPTSDEHKATDESRRGFYRHIDGVYTRLLEASLAHRWVIVTACLIVISSLYPLFRMSGVNFTPDEDESRIQITTRLPVGSSLAATQSLLDRIARDAREKLPGVSDTLAITGFGGGGGGSNSGVVFARLRPIDERDVSQQELVVRARKLTQQYRQSARIAVQGSSGIQVVSGRGAAIQYALVGPDLQKLDEFTEKAVALLDKEKTLVDVDRSYLPGRPELRIDIDRKRAADLGIRVQDVSQTVNALVAGQNVTTFNAAADQYDVVLKAQDSFRRTPDSIASATVRTSSGQLVQLRNLVTFDEGSGPASIDRLNRQRQITVTANPAPGFSQAEGQAALEQVFESLDMPPGLLARDERPVQGAGTRRVLLRHRVPAVVHLHVHGARRAVRVVPPPGHDPADAADRRAVRPVLVADLRPDPEHLFRARRAAAVRHRQEERDPPDRPHDRPAGEGLRAAYGDHPGQSRSAAAHPDDDAGAGRRHDAALHRIGAGRRDEPLDRAARRGRAVVLPAADAARRAGVLLALRRRGRIAGVGPDRPALDCGDRRVRAGRRARDRALAAGTRGSGPVMRRLLMAAAMAAACLAPVAAQVQAEPAALVTLPPRVGVAGPTRALSLEDAIRMSLEQNNAISIARLERSSALEGIRAAQGIFDPHLTPAATYQNTTTASVSSISGGTNGRLQQRQFAGSLGFDGRTPWAGGRFSADFTSSRLVSSNQFARLNPQFPSALAASYVQPLFRGRTIDAERRQILLARSTGGPVDRRDVAGHHRSAHAGGAGVLEPGVLHAQPRGAGAGPLPGTGPGDQQRTPVARRHARADRRRRGADAGRQLPPGRRLGAAGRHGGREPAEDAHRAGPLGRPLEPADRADRAARPAGPDARRRRSYTPGAGTTAGAGRARNLARRKRHQSRVLRRPGEAAVRSRRQLHALGSRRRRAHGHQPDRRDDVNGAGVPRRQLCDVAEQSLRGAVSHRGRAAPGGSPAPQHHGAREPGAHGHRGNPDSAAAAATGAGDRGRRPQRAPGGPVVAAAARRGVVGAAQRARAVPKASAAGSNPDSARCFWSCSDRQPSSPPRRRSCGRAPI